MIYTPLTKRAMEIAYNAHHGQKDKGGAPYVFHSFHIAEQMEDEITVCIALLHDVAEDTDVGIEELEKEFPREVTEALKLLTHKEGTDYFDYIREIRQNPQAVKVKLADIAHNSDESRLMGDTEISAEKKLYLREKYRKAGELLAYGKR